MSQNWGMNLINIFICSHSLNFCATKVVMLFYILNYWIIWKKNWKTTICFFPKSGYSSRILSYFMDFSFSKTICDCWEHHYCSLRSLYAIHKSAWIKTSENGNTKQLLYSQLLLSRYDDTTQGGNNIPPIALWAVSCEQYHRQFFKFLVFQINP